MTRRTLLKALLVGLAATGTGCFGSFKAVRWVYDLNKGVSGNKFIQWLVFLGLVILPVYEIAGLVDIWILNSLEFWFGGGGAASNEDEKERTVALADGRTMTMRKDVEAGRLEMLFDDGATTTELVFEMGERGARVLSAGRVIAEARSTDTAGVEVRSNDTVVATHDAATVQSLLDTYHADGRYGAAAWAGRAQNSGRVIASR